MQERDDLVEAFYKQKAKIREQATRIEALAAALEPFAAAANGFENWTDGTALVVADTAFAVFSAGLTIAHLKAARAALREQED